MSYIVLDWTNFELLLLQEKGYKKYIFKKEHV